MRALSKHRLPRWVGALSLGLLLGTGVPAMAQSQGGGYGPGGFGPAMMGYADCGYGMMGSGFGRGMMGPGFGFGPGMMGANSGYGPGMMWGTDAQGAGKSGVTSFAQARLDRLKAELKITTEQEAAWKAYGDATTAADKTLWDAMSGMHQPGMMWNATPEDRLALMSAMIQLHQTQIGDMKSAAAALMPHLSEFQKGQATEILPGIARSGFGACGMGL
jgi:hypothetical protein